MKYRHIFLLPLFAVLFAATVYASETSDKFAEWAPKMGDADAKVRENAQQNWMKLCDAVGANAELRAEVNKLMVDQLAKDNNVDASVWLIRQLGSTGDASVIPALRKALAGKDIRIRDEAARSLAMIGGEAAATALMGSSDEGGRQAKAALIFLAADKNVAAKYPHETAMPAAIPFADDAAVTALMKSYKNLDSFAKAQVVAQLAARGDKKYLSTALDAIKSDDEYLRNSGILALQKLGGTAEIPVLLEQLFSGNRDLATSVLSRIIDKGFDEKLTAQLKSEKDAGRFASLADVLVKRFNASVLPMVLERAKTDDCPNKLQLMQTVEKFADKNDAGEFFDIWAKITDRGQKDDAEKCIARLVDGDASKIIAKQTKDNAVAVYSLLGRIGDDKTMKEIVDKAVGTEKAEPEVAAAAFRAMCNWPNGKVANDLLAAAGNDSVAPNDRIQALRAFARVISLRDEEIKIRMSAKDKIALLEKAMVLATRLEEKKLIINRASQIRDKVSLEFVLKFFDDADLQQDVCRAVVDLAHHDNLRRPNKELFEPALDKVLEACKDQGLLDRAKKYKANL